METSIRDEFVQLLLQHLQNVTRDVAIQAIESLEDETKFSRQLFFEWRILEVVETIKLVKKDYMRTTIRQHLLQLDKETSYDLMMRGCLERYKYHPLTALKLFQQSIVHNSINYETRMYIANTLDSDALNKRLECSHELEYSMYICQLVIDRLQHCMFELQVDPKMLEFTMNEHYSFLYLLKGRVAINRGKTQLALQMYQKSKEYNPNSFHTHFYMGFYYGFNRGNTTENYAKSIKYFQDMCTIPQRPIFEGIIYNNIAALLIRLGRFDDSMAYYDKTLTSNPEMGWAYRDRSYLHRADGHYDQAIQDYEKCIDMKPEMMTELAQFYAYRGILHAYSDRKSDMENDLTKSIELDPTSSFSLIALSSHYADTNRPHEVMQVLENAISQSSNSFAPGDMHRLLSARHDYLAYYTAGNFPGFGGQTEKVKKYKQEMLMCSANERIA